MSWLLELVKVLFSSVISDVLFLAIHKLPVWQKKVKASCFPRPLTPKNKNMLSAPSTSQLHPSLSPVSETSTHTLMVLFWLHYMWFIILMLSPSGWAEAVYDVYYWQHPKEQQLLKERAE